MFPLALTLRQVKLDGPVPWGVAGLALLRFCHLVVYLPGRRGSPDLAPGKGVHRLVGACEGHGVAMRVAHLDRLVLQVVVSDEGLLIRDGLLRILRLEDVLSDCVLQVGSHVSLHIHHVCRCLCLLSADNAFK